jgi:hypothetical protein
VSGGFDAVHQLAGAADGDRQLFSDVLHSTFRAARDDLDRLKAAELEIASTRRRRCIEHFHG